MKPIVQVLLAVVLIAALVFLIYTQSGDKSENGSSTAEAVASEVADDMDTEQPVSAAAADTSSEDQQALDTLDVIATDEPDELAEPKASQQEQKQLGEGKPKRAPLSLREQRRRMFKKIDVDKKDGVVSEEEHAVFFLNAFQFYDKNDDGRLAGKELKQVKRLPRKADVNKDDIMTRKEFLDQFDRFFVIMDKDKSGDLTVQEFVR